MGFDNTLLNLFVLLHFMPYLNLIRLIITHFYVKLIPSRYLIVLTGPNVGRTVVHQDENILNYDETCHGFGNTLDTTRNRCNTRVGREPVG